MKDVIQRYKAILREHGTDQHSAALLVVAERIDVLVQAMINVDTVVQKIEAESIRNTPVTIPDQNAEAVKYLHDNYVR